MNKFVKSLLITTGANAFILLLGLTADPGFLVLLIFATAVEIVVGAIMMIPRQRRETGGGILVAGGISLLIGLSVCSTMSFGFH